MYFRNYRLGKTWINKCVKTLLSEHALTAKRLWGPKHFGDLHENTFITFFITLREI